VAADEIEKRMTAEGHTVASLTGQRDPAVRDAIIDNFRKGEAKVLIATNVLARGIDVSTVSMVINYVRLASLSATGLLCLMSTRLGYPRTLSARRTYTTSGFPDLPAPYRSYGSFRSCRCLHLIRVEPRGMGNAQPDSGLLQL
jgi:hypothetical protein